MQQQLVQRSLFQDGELGATPPHVEQVFSSNPLQAAFVKETHQPCFFDDGRLINPEYLAWCERKLYGTTV